MQRTYRDAGADGIFVPGLVNPEDIRTVTANDALPVNVLAHPSLTVAEVGELGVKPVSSGSLPYRAARDRAVDTVATLRDNRQTPTATSYWDRQARLATFSRRVSRTGFQAKTTSPRRRFLPDGERIDGLRTAANHPSAQPQPT